LASWLKSYGIRVPWLEDPDAEKIVRNATWVAAPILLGWGILQFMDLQEMRDGPRTLLIVGSLCIAFGVGWHLFRPAASAALQNAPTQRSALPPSTPPPHQLSDYEKGEKIRVVDEALKILSQKIKPDLETTHRDLAWNPPMGGNDADPSKRRPWIESYLFKFKSQMDSLPTYLKLCRDFGKYHPQWPDVGSIMALSGADKNGLDCGHYERILYYAMRISANEPMDTIGEIVETDREKCLSAVTSFEGTVDDAIKQLMGIREGLNK
jgi:hypothetical protein